MTHTVPLQYNYDMICDYITEPYKFNLNNTTMNSTLTIENLCQLLLKSSINEKNLYLLIQFTVSV